MVEVLNQGVAVFSNGTNSIYTRIDGGIGAPQAGTSTKIPLWQNGSRLQMAVIRNGYLWTCQNVGLAGSATNYVGDKSGTNVDRSAAQWLNFQVGSTNLAFNAYERFFDPASANAFWFYYPSVMVNCNADMVMGFSGSSPSSYIGAYYSWLFSGSSASIGPFIIQGGNTPFTGGSWGDYSYTSLDPTDDWSFWTVQEYAFSVQLGYPWATWILQLNRNP